MAEARRTTAGGTTPQPLTVAELGALWRAERKAMRLYAVAVTVLAAALALPHVYAAGSVLASIVLLGALALVGVAAAIQFGVRCPRCNSRLAAQSLLAIPERCKCCGVAIEHPASLDDELDA